jgi:short-subunit dehydrogenase
MTALITGASSGIGLELARIFAANGHDVVLVARSEGKLQALATELQSARPVRAHVIAADLSIPGAARTIVEHLDARGIAIDVLVNNAGYGVYGPFLATSLEAELAMIQVNIVALTELTKRLAPAMAARGNGRILNVASVAAFLPGPLMAVYYATKAYVLSFSEAIADELAPSGVSVTVLAPGPTESGFQTAAALEESKLMAGKRLPTSEEVARAGYNGVMARKPLIVPGLTNKVTIQLTRVTPRRFLATLVRRAQERRTRGSGGR